MVIWGWVGDPDPNSLLQILTTDAIGDSSDSQWSNPQYDTLYTQQNEAATPDARKTLMAQMQQLFYDQAPYQILYYDDELHVYRTDKFGGWQNQPTDGGTPLFVNGTINYTKLTLAGAATPSPSQAAASAGASSSAAASIRGGDTDTRAVGRGQRFLDERQHDPLLLGVIVLIVIIAVGAAARSADDATRPRTSSPATARPPTVTSATERAAIRRSSPADPGRSRWARAISSTRSSRRIGTIFLIVILNFVLFRMMPGSPDRVLLRNPNITTEVRDAARARWGLDKPLAGPARQVHRLDAAGRPRLLDQVPGPAGDRRARRPALADPHPVRSRRDHRDLPRAGPRRLHGLETRRRGRLCRQRVIAHPLFDAVLRHRHAHPRGLRDRARLVPDQRHVHDRGDLRQRRGSRSATSRGTWRCRSSRSPSG